MRESNIQTLFGKWLAKNKLEGAFELKLSKSKSLPYNAVKEHQREALLQAQDGIYHKISDSPIFAGMKSRFTARKPFDCLFVRCQAYVAICYYVPRKPKELILIDINDFIKAEMNDTRKSLTEDLAKKISSIIIELKNNY